MLIDILDDFGCMMYANMMYDGFYLIVFTFKCILNGTPIIVFILINNDVH